MKRMVVLTVLLSVLTVLLCGCFPEILFIPDKDFTGNYKVFEKDGITIGLTDKFHEQQSELGFDAYYVSDFCGVVVLKEEFSLEEGLAQKTTEEYINSVIRNNNHTNIAPQTKDGLWFYENTSNNRYVRSYAYKGSDAFYIVQFICNLSDSAELGDLFYLWASSVTVD